MEHRPEVKPFSATHHASLRPQAIIVPLDGSANARKALPFARQLAQAFGVPTHRVSVTVPTETATSDGRQVHEDVLALLRGTEQAPRLHLAWSAAGPLPPPTVVGDPVSVVSADGDIEVVLQGETTAQALLAYAEEHAGGLLCMATKARGGLHRRLVGNLTEVLLDRAVCPVVAIGPEVDLVRAGHRPDTILVAASQYLAPSTVPIVSAWAMAMDAEVVVGHVAPPTPAVQAGAGGSDADPGPAQDLLRRLLAGFAGHGVAATGHTMTSGHIAAAVLELAEQIGGSLLVAAPVGTRQDGIHGDVTHQLLQRSHWPVLASVGHPR